MLRSVCLGSPSSTKPAIHIGPYLHRLSQRVVLSQPGSSVRFQKLNSILLPSIANCSYTLVEKIRETNEKYEKQEDRVLVEEARTMLKSLSDGEVSPSAYDTAWVARIPSQSGADGPEFPQTIDWIINNQLPDGSWGDKDHFQAYDRILCTLACIVGLNTWKVGCNNVQKGISFLRKNMDKLTRDDGDLLSGFEITFPAMLDEAKAQGLEISYSLPFLQSIQESRREKLQRIPVERVHSTPTTILYSLEGLQGYIDWDRILQLQSEDGSFLSSPSSTACVFLHTKNKKCLEYLNNVMQKFGNTVPCHYPIDLFERLWVVDTLERLGIDHFFQLEINDILDYVYKYWTSSGIGWGRNSLVKDIDDTAMGFRLLRLHGYDVSAEVFQEFRSDDKFFCFAGETAHGASEMLNLYRASQVAFPDEHELGKAQKYSSEYLSRLDEQSLDKWAVKKDLSGEVLFELRNPWCASLPRVYARSYIQKYGEDDVWIAKTLYRLPAVNNKLLLDLAKSDFNRCQHIQQAELRGLFKWWNDCKFGELTFTSNKVVEAYFVIATCIFEPEFSDLRVHFAKFEMLITVFDDLADHCASPEELPQLLEAVKRWDQSAVSELSTNMQICFSGLYKTINEMACKASEAQRGSPIDIRHQFQRQFSLILNSQVVDAKWIAEKRIPRFEEYIENAKISSGIQGLVLTSMFFAGEMVSEETLEHVSNSKFLQLSCFVFRLLNDITTFEREMERGELASSISCYMNDHPETTKHESIQHLRGIVKGSMEQLTGEYLRAGSKIPQAIKRLIFETARMTQFMYMERDNFRTPDHEMRDVINNVLFEAIS